MKRKTLFSLLLALSALVLGALFIGLTAMVDAQGPEPQGDVGAQAALGTAFTYQGQLTEGGSVFSDTCDFQFSLYADSGGSTQVGSTQTKTVDVTNGLFTIADLDFGSGAFNGEARWLKIAVRCPAGSGDYTTLTPLQALTPAPYALALPGLWTQQNATSPNLIGGYSGNWVTAGAVGATIGGGGDSMDPNRVTDNYGTVGGGVNNQAGDNAGTTLDAFYATVGGGLSNIASGSEATVGGGSFNTASGGVATVGGGGANIASSDSATVGGGAGNTASGSRATVGGGASNLVTATYGTIGGGASNVVTAPYGTIGGGGCNTASGIEATVGGGEYNTASDWYATVSGGWRNTASDFSATVGGGERNSASGDWATVGGGEHISVTGEAATVAGGSWITVTEDYAAVGGGRHNTASGHGATVGGGGANIVSGTFSTVSGGAQNIASGDKSTISGGDRNTASGGYATIPGGDYNTAEGDYSFAAGLKAKAYAPGCFVWGDSWVYDDVPCNDENRWVARASGGVYFYTTPTLTSGVFVAAGGNSWNSISDRVTKENFTPVDGRAILEKLATLPIQEYNLKSQDPSIHHIGPVAQDFAAFGYGESDRAINMEDADGVALAAIQGLYELSQEQAAHIQTLDVENAALQAENAAQQEQIDNLEARLAALEAASANSTASAQPLQSGLLPGAGILLAGLGLVWFNRRDGALSHGLSPPTGLSKGGGR